MLKEIEITGFKSFAKKSVLSFSRPVTAIVGPNGSGKSNVVESIRFVLGEQSMKSLRGKSGSDLVFKGSKNLSKLSRASVSLTFDNAKKIFKFPSGEKNGISLDFDKIVLSREVFTDGVSRYLVNGSEVRLKDIIELLSSINIGASGHHIISQGEADRLLSSSSRERREMIEDALGLKIYQYRLKDADRKINKTRENVKEVQVQKREIAPHITFLKKQVEKIEKAKILREELSDLYGEYLAREENYIKGEEATLKETLHKLEGELKVVMKSFDGVSTDEREMSSDVDLQAISEERALLRKSHDELSRKIGRIEALLELARGGPDESIHELAPVSQKEVARLVDEIDRLIEFVMSKTSIHDIFPTLKKIQETSKAFREKLLKKSSGKSENKNEKLDELLRDQKSLLDAVSKIEEKESELVKREEKIKKESQEAIKERHEREAKRYELMTEKNRLLSEKEKIGFRGEVLDKVKNDYESEMREAGVLLGAHMLHIDHNNPPAGGEKEERSEQEARHKKIERIKIKLEEAGIGGSGEIVKEYEEVLERDKFLTHELDDLMHAMTSLETLIKDLKDKLDVDFKSGVEKINKEFQNFFSLMFGGGSAFLSIVVEKPRKKRGVSDEDLEEEMEVDEEERFEQGIEINISLPHKKVRDLAMLSGGERSLTSIALLFAITQVNPPPFLVLDETDAALDEANSRKYGEMLVALSKISQLIVVTHNRETMSRADTIYGVTIGADGGSKLLSIQFDEAVAVAK